MKKGNMSAFGGKKIFLFSIIFLSLLLVGCQQNMTQNTNQDSTNIKVGKVAVLNTIETNTNNQNTNMNEEVITVTQATIKTSLGDIIVKFYNEDASKTVENFVKLASQGFYDGVKFHRVIKDFMIQSGDPLSKDDSTKSRWGTGGSGYQFADEINSHKLVKGSLAMANSGPNTNGSQFFIVTADATSWLDGKHTNFGEVISGIEIVEQIENVETEGSDRPVEDVVIESIELE